MDSQKEPSLPPAAVSLPPTSTAAPPPPSPPAPSVLSKPAAPAATAVPRPTTTPQVQQTNTTTKTTTTATATASIPRATFVAPSAPFMNFPRPQILNLPPSQLAMLSRSIVQHTFLNMPPPRAPPAPPASWKPHKKRGRPVGSVDKAPRKKPALNKTPAFVHVLKLLPTTRADKAVELAVERQKMAQSKIAKAQEAVEQAQKTLEAAKDNAKSIDAAYNRAIKKQADAKLLAFEEASKSHDHEKKGNNTAEDEFSWFQYYQSLQAFKEKVGHSHVKRRQDSNFKIGNRSVKSLARWGQKQRANKRAGTIEPYQEELLNRVDFEWTPKQGPDGTKWWARYEELKKYKETHGNCNVARREGKLGYWVGAQRTQYRNNLNGKIPALTQERIGLLNELGFDWGEEVNYTAWDSRFEELKEYKLKHGHANVPWRWIHNRPLAHWVVTQRNKYKALKDGKQTNLTQEQIEKMESIGFSWSTGGTGKYDRSSEEKALEASIEKEVATYTASL